MPPLYVEVCIFYTLVLMAPETATTKPWCTMFSDKYIKKHLVLLAVDEAHCISDWSVDMGSHFLPY